MPCPPWRAAELDGFLAAGFPSLGAVPASRRFPHALFPGAPGVLVALEERIVGACVVRSFTARVEGERVTAAMIGLVLVAPERRSAGLGSRLVAAAEAHARAQGARVAVLWAKRHGFYERLGWEPGDAGAIAELDPGDAATAAPGDAPARPPDPEVIALIESVRRPAEAPVVERDARAYAALPPPGVALEAHVAPDGRAYALVARTPERGYVVDLEGAPDALPAVWTSVRRAHARLLVNARAGSRAQEWLAAEGALAFAPQRLALWRRLDPSAPSGWHVPWLDRI